MFLFTKLSFFCLLFVIVFFIHTSQSTTDCQSRSPCNFPLDLVFVLDESSSINPTSFQNLKLFVKEFVSRLTIAPSGVHVGCVMFGTSGRIILSVNSPGAANPAIVQNSFNSLVQVPGNGGHTNTQAGITLARTMFTASKVSRSVKKQILLLVTDGNPSLPAPLTTARKQALDQASKAKKEGVLIFGIAVGRNVNSSFISSLSSSPKYTFSTRDFSQLRSIILTLLDQSCYQPPSITTRNVILSCRASISPLNTGFPNVTGWCHGCAPSVPRFSDVVIPGFCPRSKTIKRTWIVSDKCGGVAKQVQWLQVSDTTPPIFWSFPEDRVVECEEDTSISSLGEATAEDNCDLHPSVVFRDNKTPGTCSKEYNITRTFKAQDACGNKVQKNQLIQIRDSIPPAVTKVNSFCLWPPNHKYYCIENLTVSDLVEATDICRRNTYLKFIGCTSNQPDTDRGDNTSDDCTYNSTSDTLCVRSERSPFFKEDRIYSIQLEVLDSLDPICANSIETTLNISVPRAMKTKAIIDCRAPNSDK